MSNATESNHQRGAQRYLIPNTASERVLFLRPQSELQTAGRTLG